MRGGGKVGQGHPLCGCMVMTMWLSVCVCVFMCVWGHTQADVSVRRTVYVHVHWSRHAPVCRSTDMCGNV